MVKRDLSGHYGRMHESIIHSLLPFSLYFENNPMATFEWSSPFGEPVPESRATSFNHNDLASQFGPVAYHTRLNRVKPIGSQSCNALRPIIRTIERAIGSKTFDAIQSVVDPELQRN